MSTFLCVLMGFMLVFSLIGICSVIGWLLEEIDDAIRRPTRLHEISHITNEDVLRIVAKAITDAERKRKRA